MTDTIADGLPCANTDRELWREREGDYYANSIHVTEHGSIGIDVGGTVIVKPLRDWHALALTPNASVPAELVERMMAELERQQVPFTPFDNVGKGVVCIYHSPAVDLEALARVAMPAGRVEELLAERDKYRKALDDIEPLLAEARAALSGEGR